MWNWYVLAATTRPCGHASVRVCTGPCVTEAMRATADLPAHLQGSALERDYGLPPLSRLKVMTMLELVRALGGRIHRFRTLGSGAPRSRANTVLAALPIGRIGVRTREDDIAWEGYLDRIGKQPEYPGSQHAPAPLRATDPPPDTDTLFEPYVGPDRSDDE